MIGHNELHSRENEHVDSQRGASRQRSLQSMALQARGIQQEAGSIAGHAACLRFDVDDCNGYRLCFGQDIVS